MSRRTPILVVSAATLLSGVLPVAAQVDEAQDRADRAASEADAAHEIVTSAIADREEVELALFEALDRYQMAASDLTEASIRLERLDEAVAFADAEAVSAEERLAGHTVTAYMEAVAVTAGVVFDTDTVEDAIVVGQAVRESQQEALATLGDLLARRAELERLRAEHAVELDQVSASEESLQTEAAELEALFARANDEVAAAYAVAAQADAEYRSALAGVERAIAEEEAARRATETVTTSSTTPATTTSATTTTVAQTTTTSAAGASTTTPSTTTTAPTTTTTPPAEWPPIPINEATMAWRPLIEQHFASDLALDALVIIQCESLGDPDAVNPWSGASGLFQFMPGTWAVASVQAGVGDRSVFDGEANIIAASWLAEYYRERSGEPWRPWSCRRYL